MTQKNYYRIGLLTLFTLLLVGFVQAALTDGLVSYYEGGVSGSFDDNATGYDGTIHGATYTTSGKLGSAYYFVTNDYINLSQPWSSFVTLTGNFSFNVWYNHSGTTTSQYIIGTRESATGHGMGLESSYSGGTTYLTFQAWDGANGGINSVITTLPHKRWHMATIIRSGDNFEMLIDGVSQGNTTKATFNPTVVAQVSLGRRTGNNDRYFEGAIDEVGIWSRDLTRAEVTSLYNSGTGLNPYNEGIVNRPPFTPTLNSPASSTEYSFDTTSVTLNVTCGDPEGDDLRALFYADTHTSPTTLINTSIKKINNSHFTYDFTVSEGNTYYWKAKCLDNNSNEGTLSTERNFIVNVATYREPSVTLTSPLDGEIINTGYFNFTPLCYSSDGCSARLYINNTILPALDYDEPADPFIIGWIEPTLYKGNGTHYIWGAGSMANEYDIDIFTSPYDDPTNWTYLCNGVHDESFLTAGTTIVDNGTHTFMYTEADGGDMINLYMGSVNDICTFTFVDSIILATDPDMRVQVSDPGVIYDEPSKSFHMYFDNIDPGSGTSRNQIWYANSTDGINYHNFSLVMDNTYNSWTGSRPGNPEPFLYKDYYHLISKVDLNSDNGTLGSYFAIQLIGKQGEITDWTALETYDSYNPFYFARAVITNEWKDDFTRPVVYDDQIYFFFTDSNSEAVDKGMTYIKANLSKWEEVSTPIGVVNNTMNSIFHNFTTYVLPSTFAWNILINQSDLATTYATTNSTVYVYNGTASSPEFVDAGPTTTITGPSNTSSQTNTAIIQYKVTDGYNLSILRLWHDDGGGYAIINTTSTPSNNTVYRSPITMSVGEQLFIAEGCDGINQCDNSTPVSYTVLAPDPVPTISVQYPTSGLTIYNTTINVSCLYSDSDSATATIKIYLDQNLNSTNSSANNNTVWNTTITHVTYASHNIKCEVNDGTNAINSTTIAFTVATTTSGGSGGGGTEVVTTTNTTENTTQTTSFNEALCGDGVINNGETFLNCPSDIPPSYQDYLWCVNAGKEECVWYDKALKNVLLLVGLIGGFIWLFKTGKFK